MVPHNYAYWYESDTEGNQEFPERLWKWRRRWRDGDVIHCFVGLGLPGCVEVCYAIHGGCYARRKCECDSEENQGNDDA